MSTSPGSSSEAGEPGTITWGELLSEAKGRLSRFEDMEPRWIVEEASSTSSEELPLVLGDLVTESGMARFDAMIARREAGEPLQYVLGHWPFRELDLMVDPRVLIPRPETELVTEIALTELDRLGGRETETTVVDLGTGSGAIGLSIVSERVRSKVWATDFSDDALAVARANLAGLGRAATRVTLAHGSWYVALPDALEGTVDLIVTNPPYVPAGQDLPTEVAAYEPTSALYSGELGLDDLQQIISGATNWLSGHGVLVSEISPEQADAVEQIADEHFGEIRIEPDLTGRARALVARQTK